MPPFEPPRIRIGISACLLGKEVRYNGDHKRDAFLTERDQSAVSNSARVSRRMGICVSTTPQTTSFRTTS